MNDLPTSFPDPFLNFEPPSDEEMERNRRARTLGRLQAARAARPSSDVFSAVSLADWVRVATTAGVPSVPAEVVASLPISAIFRFEDPAPEDKPHWQAILDARAALKPDEMMRWACCASLDMKSMMAEGGVSSNDRFLTQPDSANPNVPTWRTLTSVDDPRFIDIALDSPTDAIDVIKRPWVEARREGSHPVEYRVFVANGVVRGVANYYVQRSLEATDQVRDEIGQAIGMTRQLIASMATTGSIPFNIHADRDRNGFDPDLASCTLDFLVSEAGEVLFLEAGPPFGLGAHPCAFMPTMDAQPGREQIMVDGVCLAVGAAPLPLADFERPPVSGDHAMQRAETPRA